MVGGLRARAPGALAALGTLALLSCAGGPRLTHVLLISIDSLRADHLGAYGYARPTSPRIDRLAREGTLFERALSSTSWTLPAHAALFTGLADSRHGVVSDAFALSPQVPTLAASLAQAGFATGAVVSGPYLHPRYGLARGFGDYLNCMGFLDDGFGPLPGPRVNIHIDSHSDVTTPCVVRRAREWLSAHRAGPAFLFLHFWDVHYDYRPPSGYAERFDPGYDGALDASGYESNTAVDKGMARRDLEHLVALYDGEVAFADEGVGAVLDLLGEIGIAGRTLVLLVSDHGDAFFEHGEKGHQKDLHAEVVRIPLVLRGPGVPAGARRPGPAHITDVAPTILALLGLPWQRPGRPGEGMSLVPALASPNALAGRTLLMELFQPVRYAALEGLAVKLSRNLATGELLAYDLRRDPGELSPIPPPDAFVSELEARLKAIQPLAAPEPVAPEDLPPELDERLRALGYVK